MIRAAGSTRIRAVTFDATGTLFVPRDLGGDYHAVLARHGLEIAPVELARLIPEVWREFACTATPERDRFAAHPEGGRGFWRALLERVCERAGADHPTPFAAAELYERFAHAEAWQVFPEVTETLTALHAANLRLAIVSNWDARLPRLLERLGLLPWFEAVVASEQVGVEKPHPGIFARALTQLGVEAAETVHVGDRRLEDLEGATAAGLRGFLLAREGGGDLMSLAELPERIARLA